MRSRSIGLLSKPVGFRWDRSDIAGATSDSLKRIRNSRASCARGEAKNSDSSWSMPTETCMRFSEEKVGPRCPRNIERIFSQPKNRRAPRFVDSGTNSEGLTAAMTCSVQLVLKSSSPL